MLDTSGGQGNGDLVMIRRDGLMGRPQVIVGTLLILAVVLMVWCVGKQGRHYHGSHKAWSRVMDQLEIERLIHDYTALLGREAYQAYGELFASGCLLSPDGRVMARGADQVAALARYFLGSQPERHTRHIISSPRIDIDPDGRHATARSFLTTIDAESDGPAEVFRIGHYKDRFRKEEGRWFFVSRQELTDWVLLERTRRIGSNEPVDVGSIVAAAEHGGGAGQIECYGFDGERL